MNDSRRFWVSALVLAIVSASGCKKPPEPEKPFQMTLQLAKRTWRSGEAPWYLLQVKNAGYQKRYLDPFWYTQDKLDSNSDYRTATGSKGHDTFLEIRDPDGKLMVPDCLAEWGYHREFRFWDNDYSKTPQPIKPGQTVTASPTIVAPVRMELRNGHGPADARIPSNVTPEERKAYGELWKQYKNQLVGEGLPNELTKDPRVRYPGYRVLECYFFKKLGVYRMKTVMDTTWDVTPVSADEELAQSNRRLGRPATKKYEDEVLQRWAAMTPQQLEKKHKRRAEDDMEAKEKPGFYVESNAVEFEVLP